MTSEPPRGRQVSFELDMPNRLVTFEEVPPAGLIVPHPKKVQVPEFVLLLAAAKYLEMKLTSGKGLPIHVQAAVQTDQNGIKG